MCGGGKWFNSTTSHHIWVRLGRWQIPNLLSWVRFLAWMLNQEIIMKLR